MTHLFTMEQFTKADLLAVMLFADVRGILNEEGLKKAKKHASLRRRLSSTVLLLL